MKLRVLEQGILYGTENPKKGDLSGYMPYFCQIHNNQVAISADGGKSFGAPIDTGIKGQATGICSLGGEYVMTLHSMRKNVERYGVQACIADVSDGKWNVVHTEYIWEPEFAINKVDGVLGVFDMLQLGQPSAIRLKDGTLLYTQWLMENEVCRTIWIRLAAEE